MKLFSRFLTFDIDENVIKNPLIFEASPMEVHFSSSPAPIAKKSSARKSAASFL